MWHELGLAELAAGVEVGVLRAPARHQLLVIQQAPAPRTPGQHIDNIILVHLMILSIDSNKFNVTKIGVKFNTLRHPLNVSCLLIGSAT